MAWRPGGPPWGSGLGSLTRDSEAAIADAESMESTKAPSRPARPAEMPSNAKGNLRMTEMMWSLTPWLTFMTASSLFNLWAGLAGGGLVALAVLGRAVAHRKVHMLDVASIAFFLALASALVVVHPGDLGSWNRYAQPGAHGLLTALVFGSVLLGRPFTEAYARPQTPPAVWHSPRFEAFNRELSLVWGLALLVGTLSLALAGAVSAAPFVLRVAVPMGAMIVATKYTQQQASHARRLLPSAA